MQFKKLFCFLCAATFFGLALSASAKAEILFNGTWDDFGTYFQGYSSTSLLWTADFHPGHWHIIQEKGLDRITVVDDPTSPNKGKVAHIIVRPGDNVGWTGERAEVSDMLTRDQNGKTTHFPVLESDGHEFYAIAVKLAPDWQSPENDHGREPLYGIFAQLHSPNVFSGPPPFALSVDNEFHVALCGGDLLDGGKLRVHKNSITYPISKGSLNKGQWVEFVVDVTWSYTNNGHIVLYRRDQGEHDFIKVFDMENIPTLQSQYGTPEGTAHHYWKVGYYRSMSPDVINELWMGPLVRGTTFNDVVKAAFGG